MLQTPAEVLVVKLVPESVLLKTYLKEQSQCPQRIGSAAEADWRSASIVAHSYVHCSSWQYLESNLGIVKHVVIYERIPRLR